VTGRVDTTALRRLLAEATPGEWFMSYSAVCSAALSAARHAAEDLLTDDSPDSAWDALPSDLVLRVPIAAGDTPTAQGANDARLAAALRNAALALLDEVDEQRAQDEHRNACVVCGDVLLPAPPPHCEGCDLDAPWFTWRTPEPEQP